MDATTVKTCIIYSPIREVGTKQLNLIIIEKACKGIGVVKENLENGDITFADGEQWRVINLNVGGKGYKWDKAMIDAGNITVKELYGSIIPAQKGEEKGVGSNYQFFNW